MLEVKMNGFNIQFDTTRQLPSDVARPAVWGVIEIGEFRESFIVSLNYWSMNDYVSQWKDAAQTLLDGKGRSAFITDLVGPPDQLNFLVWWPVYRYEDLIYVPNQLLFMDQLDRPFDLASPYLSVRERETESVDEETGERTHISEWTCSVDAIRHYASLL